MARFSLRPILRRFSSKHSAAAESTQSDTSETTAATSTSPSPQLPSQSPARRPRKSSSLAKLKEKFRDHDIPEVPLHSRAASVSVIALTEAGEIGTRSRAHTTGTEADVVEAFEGQQQQQQQQQQQDKASTAAAAAAAADLELPDSKLQPAIRSADASVDDLSQSPPQPSLKLHVDDLPVNPTLVVEQPTPDALGWSAVFDFDGSAKGSLPSQPDLSSGSRPPSASQRSLQLSVEPEPPLRRQSLVESANASIVRALIEAPTRPGPPVTSISTGAIPSSTLPEYWARSIPDMAAMLQRKIWVKRPSASATLVQIREDDLVDDVRDMILRKYANSLGKTFDSPDLTLTIVTRSDHAGPRSSRILGPEEEICRTLDTYYSGGQTVEEALIIDLPQKRTPRPSPRPQYHHSYHAMDNFRPQEEGTDYFPPMPVTIQPALLNHLPREHAAASEHPRSISVLNTGQLPPLASPGVASRRHRAEREHRPKYTRKHTSSPTILSHGTAVGSASLAGPALPTTSQLSRSARPRVDSSASEVPMPPNGAPVPPPLPSPPAPEAAPTAKAGSNPPTPNGALSSRPRKTRKPTPDKLFKGRGGTPQVDTYNPNATLPAISSVLDGSVPPINVLIVEDNIINLRILEGLMKRLKVRWQTAMNGQIAVDKWKTGGYHLVLMDIQMPVMNGLQATKEIRRLERVNGIGVFSSTPGTNAENRPGGDANGEGKHDPENDKLATSEGLFKSPIIIVALTASSLQSDRHEALAAGCNDFLTKPVNFVWLERKVKEWGCMQALIDFDGWRKWKDYAAKEEEGKSAEQKQKDRESEEKQKIKMEKMAKLQEKQRERQEKEAKEKERKKRESAGEPVSPSTGPEEPSVPATA